MSKLILLRHGESEGNVCRDLYYTKPTSKIELTTKGKLQAYTAGERLAQSGHLSLPLVSFVSPYARTTGTWEYFSQGARDFLDADLLGSFQEESLIREWDWGTYWAHRRFPESTFESCMADLAEDPQFYQFPCGESYAQVLSRANAFFYGRYLQLRGVLTDLEPHLLCGGSYDVVLVSHGNFIKAFLQVMLGKDFEWQQQLDHLRNGEYLIWEYSYGKFDLVDGELRGERGGVLAL